VRCMYVVYTQWRGVEMSMCFSRSTGAHPVQTASRPHKVIAEGLFNYKGQ
jgi:hypothetical protein